MSPLHIAGIVGGGIMAAGAIWIVKGFIDSRDAALIEAKTYEIAAMQERLARQYEKEAAQLSQAHADELARKNREITETTARYQNEITQLRSTLESQAIEAPFDTGNDFERRVRDVMCRINRSNNGDHRQACRVQASEAYSPDKSIFITVTADTSAQWAEQCDDGQRDFCDYAIVGMTAQGALTMLSWLNEVDAYQYRLNEYIDNQDAVLSAVMEQGSAPSRLRGHDQDGKRR